MTISLHIGRKRFGIITGGEVSTYPASAAGIVLFWELWNCHPAERKIKSGLIFTLW